MGKGGTSTLRFQVLGPLRVWHAGTELVLGSLQQRVVLAVLLLHANQPVRRDRLIDAVWGDSAPAYGINQLQKHISGLRGRLEPKRAESSRSQLLVWTDQGYVLRIPEDRIDLAEFEHHMKAARSARAVGDLSAQAGALHAALGLWHGRLCDGLTSPFLDAARDRLAERQVDAIEARINVDLDLGRHAEVVNELRDAVAAHPVRERLRGLFMRALYRCGRQAEALTAFQDARKHLREELGVDPGVELQQLHRQILTGELGLAASGSGQRLRPSGAVPSQRATAGPDEIAPPAGPGAAGPRVASRGDADRRGAGRDGSGPHVQLPPPSQLPRGQLDFVGRAAELERLHGLLDHDAPRQPVVVVSITGTAGVGKTALAVHWAHQVRDLFPDGQLYVNLRGFDPTGTALEPAEAIRGFIDAFAIPPQLVPAGLAPQTALYRSLLAGRRVLVVLDNARNPDQVRPLLPGSPGCVVVVTSRDALVGLVAEGAVAVPLDLFDAAESHELLARRLGRARVEAEPQVIDDLVVASARLPLALSVVAARLTAQSSLPLAVLAGQIHRAQASLELFDGADPATNVQAVLSWSYRTLTPGAARMFRLLGQHPGPHINTAAAASLAAETIAEARTSLNQLTLASLLTEHALDRFAFHDLIRLCAVTVGAKHDSAADRQAARTRLFEHYLHTAMAADQLLDPHRFEPDSAPPGHGVVPEPIAGIEQAVAWFADTYQTIAAAVKLAEAVGADTFAWQLAWTLTTYLDRAGLWHEASIVQLTALRAAYRTDDRRAPARIHRNVAWAYTRLGRTEEARDHLSRALELYREVEDATGQAHVRMNFAQLAGMDGLSAAALSHAADALQLFDEAGDVIGRADALTGVGWYLAQTGEFERPLSYCEEALSIHQRTGDREGEAQAWDSLGYVHHQLGNHDRAGDCYDRAIVLRRALNDRYGEAATLVRLGDTLEATGQRAAARQRWRDGLVVLEEFSHPDASLVRSRLNEARPVRPPGVTSADGARSVASSGP